MDQLFPQSPVYVSRFTAFFAQCRWRQFLMPTYPNYDSEAPHDFARFISRLHSPANLKKKDYLQVKVVRFHKYLDTMRASGILHLLNGTLGIRVTVSISASIVRCIVLFVELTRSPVNVNNLDDPPHQGRLPGDLGVAADMCRQVLQAHQGDPDSVPLWKWFQIIVWLLRRCDNIETIEVPIGWLRVRWYEPRFPKIDMFTQVYVTSGHIRYGRDPGM